MTKQTGRAILLAALSSTVALSVFEARAGGPLLTLDGEPTRWARTLTQGGPLNLKTVDESGRVLYRVDTGPLGPLTNERAVALVDRIFRLYSEVPTASIEFVNAGPILDPDSGNPIDVNGSNFGRIRSSRSFQNPIIFDSDGSITGGGGVLGLFGFAQLDPETNSLKEGIVVLNGGAIGLLGEVPFLGVFTHEFGHFAGPLDHAQINGNIASRGADAIPPGFSAAQAYDLFAPFTETLFPFLFDAPGGSRLFERNFGNSGFFIASLDTDTRNALSNLYPEPGYNPTDPGSNNGAIEGRALIRTSSGDVPVSGINVIARRISRGAFPPPASAEAFPGFQIALDADGVPIPPPDQDVTDPLAFAVSSVTGQQFGPGVYRINGLAPGQYLVEIQRVNSGAVGGSAIGGLDTPLPLPVPESYNGARESGESSDSPADFEPVIVSAGSAVTGIDIILNGFNPAAIARVDEQEPNHKKKKAQRIELPVELVGAAAYTDSSVLRMEFPFQPPDPIEDLYRFTLNSTTTLFVILEPINGSGDLDMYVFDSTLGKKRVQFESPTVQGFSAGPTADEMITVRLAPGTYYIGVSAFEGTSLNYRLRILAAQ